MRILALWRYFFGKSRKLKPCPFCGKHPQMAHCGVSYAFYCNNENCKIQPETRGSRCMGDAVDEWNSRSNIMERIRWPRN